MQKNSDSALEIDAAICRNIGSDGISAVWECRADLPKDYKFERATVNCEGWNGPGDNQIVPGSCVLEYTIKDLNVDWNMFSLLLTIALICIILFLAVKCSVC